MPERHRLAILLMAWCALRFGEVSELRRRDLVLSGDNPRIKVRRAVVLVGGQRHGHDSEERGWRPGRDDSAAPPGAHSAASGPVHRSPGRTPCCSPGNVAGISRSRVSTASPPGAGGSRAAWSTSRPPASARPERPPDDPISTSTTSGTPERSWRPRWVRRCPNSWNDWVTRLRLRPCATSMSRAVERGPSRTRSRLMATADE